MKHSFDRTETFLNVLLNCLPFLICVDFRLTAGFLLPLFRRYHAGFFVSGRIIQQPLKPLPVIGTAVAAVKACADLLRPAPEPLGQSGAVIQAVFGAVCETGNRGELDFRMFCAVCLTEAGRPQIEIEQQILIPEIVRPGQGLFQQLQSVLPIAGGPLHPQQSAHPAQVGRILDGLDQHGGGKMLRLLEIVPCQRVIGEDGQKLPGLFLAELLFLQKVLHQGDSLSPTAQGHQVFRHRTCLAHRAVGHIIPLRRPEPLQMLLQRGQIPSHHGKFPGMALPQPLPQAICTDLIPELRQQTFALLQRNLGQAAGDGTGQHGHRDHDVSLGLSQFAGIFLMEPHKLRAHRQRLGRIVSKYAGIGQVKAARQLLRGLLQPVRHGHSLPAELHPLGRMGEFPVLLLQFFQLLIIRHHLQKAFLAQLVFVLITHICFLPFHDNLYLL